MGGFLPFLGLVALLGRRALRESAALHAYHRERHAVDRIGLVCGLRHLGPGSAQQVVN